MMKRMCHMIMLLLTTLASVAQESTPKDTTYTVWSTYQKLQKQYPHIVPVQPIQSAEIKEEYEVTYTQVGGRSLHADVFYPPSSRKKSPAVVLVHGGGWRSGDKSMNTPLAQQLALRGYVAMSVEYQLSQEAKYPAAVYNLKAAIRWLRANTKKYNIDETNIAIIGGSAGGQLAALTGATNGRAAFEESHGYEKFSSKVQAVIDLDGLLDFTDPENLAVKRNTNSADVVWLGGTYDSIPDTWRNASALYHVDKNTPPFLFINSTQTRFHAGYRQMAERLEALDIRAHVIKLEDAPHSYWLFHPWFEPMTNHIVEFLDNTLKKKSIKQ